MPNLWSEDGSAAILLAPLEVAQNSFHRARVSKIQNMESKMPTVSQREPRQIRAALDEFIEDKMKFTLEFKHSILRSESHLTHGEPVRVCEPQGS